MNLKLLVTNRSAQPEAAPAVCEIDQAHCIVGRVDSHLQVADRQCSRQHVLLYEGYDGKLHLRDLGSRNGTFVNGKRVSGGIINVGDEIRIGASTIEVLDYRSSIGFPQAPAEAKHEQPEEEQITETNHFILHQAKQSSEVVNEWPKNLLAIPKKNQADFVEYVDAEGTKTRIQLAELLKQKESKTGSDKP
jgi:pSer/pThr/pTyr-binding forkhead associated (FHA) protein